MSGKPANELTSVRVTADNGRSGCSGGVVIGTSGGANEQSAFWHGEDRFRWDCSLLRYTTHRRRSLRRGQSRLSRARLKYHHPGERAIVSCTDRSSICEDGGAPLSCSPARTNETIALLGYDVGRKRRYNDKFYELSSPLLGLLCCASWGWW